ncbi:hypothetical protein BJX64DRAFT_290498 [Aspergillus heterothallicus]
MNRSDAVFLSLWVASLAVIWVSMVLRFVARGLILKTMRWDDALATVSLFVATASVVCAILRYQEAGSLSKGDKVSLMIETPMSEIKPSSEEGSWLTNSAAPAYL